MAECESIESETVVRGFLDGCSNLKAAPKVKAGKKVSAISCSIA